MKYCPKCGSEFQDWVDKCLDCGSQVYDTRLRTTPSPAEQAKRKEKEPAEPLVCVAAVSSEAEASLLLGMLENEGVHSIEIPSSVYLSKYAEPSIVGTARSSYICVRASDAEKAREIIAPVEDVPEEE